MELHNKGSYFMCADGTIITMYVKTLFILLTTGCSCSDIVKHAEEIYMREWQYSLNFLYFKQNLTK